LPCQDATSALPAGTEPVFGGGADLQRYQSLRECLKAVPEPRRRCGIRHNVAVVLAFAVAAVLAGADSVTAVSERAADVPAEVLAVLGAWTDRRGRRVPPSRSTFRRVLARLDGETAAFGSG
jgi:DDE_Tnp_1-associated